MVSDSFIFVLKSYLIKISSTAESLEEMINFSCETIPSAYHSLKDVREESRDNTNNQSNRTNNNNKRLRTFESNNQLSTNRKKVSWAPNENISRSNVT